MEPSSFLWECENYCLQAEIWFDHRQTIYFQNGRHKIAVKNQIIIAGLKIHSNAMLLVISWCRIYCRHTFYFIIQINCPNSRWPPKLLTHRVFYHNFQIKLTGDR